MIASYLMMLFLGTATEAEMDRAKQALTMQVIDTGSAMEVRLIAHSPRDQQIGYTIEVTGQSTSRHRGKTSVAEGQEHLLSTIRTSKSDDWCARVTVEEEGRAPYVLTEGACG